MEKVIQLSKIKDPGLNPRKTYNKESIKELASSIKEQGLLQPILVRKSGSNGSYDLIVGSRRVKAYEQLKLNEILCQVVEADDDQVRSMMIVENMQREEVHPMEEAQAIKALYTIHKTYEAVAAKLGKTTHHVARRIKLNELSSKGKKLMTKGDMSLEQALVLCIAPQDVQDSVIDSEWRWDIPTLEDVKDGIRSEMANISEAPFDLTDEKLDPKIGPCVGCAHNTGTNETLFNDVLEDHRCQKPKCYHGKVATFIKQKEDELKQKGTKYVRMTNLSSYMSNNKKLLTDDDVIVLDGNSWNAKNQQKDCPDIKVGLVMESRSPKDLGSTLRICTNLKCKIHNNRGNSSGGSVKQLIPEKEKKHEAAARKLKNRWQRENNQDRKATREEIVNDLIGLESNLSVVEMQIIGVDMVSKYLGTYSTGSVDLMVYLGMIEETERKSYEGWNAYGKGEKKIKEYIVDSHTFNAVIRGAMAINYRYLDKYDPNQTNPIKGSDELLLVAKSHKISAEAIYKGLQDDRKDKRADQQEAVKAIKSKYQQKEKDAKALVNAKDGEFFDLIKAAKGTQESFRKHKVSPKGSLVQLAKKLNLDEPIKKDAKDKDVLDMVWNKVQSLKSNK